MNKKDQDLFSRILSFKYDPLSFCRYVFPWGVKKTPLANIPDLRTWQIEELERLRDHIMSNRVRISEGKNPDPYYMAIASGRGIGKSAFLSMIEYYVISCWLGGTVIVTANTEPQLKSRTMAELGKWHAMALNRHWFDKKSLSLRPQKWFTDLLNAQLSMDTQYYYVEGQNWSEESPDSFAGAHSQIAMALVYDEASGIPDPIWSVSEGFFTDLAELRLWIAISNGRRNSGNFYECFYSDSHRWKHRNIDARTVEGTDHAVYQRIIDKYGENHRESRVEVRGLFPETGDVQFISRSVVDDAITRDVPSANSAPLCMGVDVARYGDDNSVIRFRKGRDARSYPVYRFKSLDLMSLSAEVATLIDKYSPNAVFVDGGGVGGGVVDRLQQLGYRVIDVQAGASARNKERFKNKRAEMWSDLRDWLQVGAIDDSESLSTDLTAPEYVINKKGLLQIEPKDDMKKRGYSSPDDADALALTFAEPVAGVTPNNVAYLFGGQANIDYDVFEM